MTDVAVVGEISKALPANIEKDTTYNVIFTFNNTNTTQAATDVTVIKDFPDGFTETSDTCSGSILAGGSCQITGAFKPTKLGPVAINATLSYNEGDDVELTTTSDVTDVVFNNYGFNLYGSAIKNSHNINLTTNRQNQKGSLASYKKLDFNKNFSIQFNFTFSCNQWICADGIAFVIYNDPKGPSSLGESGSGLGARGITKGVALKIDSYGVIKSIQLVSSSQFDPISGNKSITTLYDENEHSLIINWNAGKNELHYSIDSEKYVDTISLNLSQYLGSEKLGYIAITSATGLYYATHTISGLQIDSN